MGVAGGEEEKEAEEGEDKLRFEISSAFLSPYSS